MISPASAAAGGKADSRTCRGRGWRRRGRRQLCGERSCEPRTRPRQQRQRSCSRSTGTAAWYRRRREEGLRALRGELIGEGPASLLGGTARKLRVLGAAARATKAAPSRTFEDIQVKVLPRFLLREQRGREATRLREEGLARGAQARGRSPDPDQASHPTGAAIPSQPMHSSCAQSPCVHGAGVQELHGPLQSQGPVGRTWHSGARS
jgi:hypothetical protein